MKLRQILAVAMLGVVVALGIGMPAHAEPKTVQVAQDGYTYSCTTVVQAKESMKLEIDGVQYSCYSQEKQDADDASSNILLTFLIFMLVVAIIVMLFVIATTPW